MELLDVLKHNKKLKHLNLSDNNLVMPISKVAGNEGFVKESEF